MEALNLATLSIDVQATGISQAQQQLTGLTNTVQQTGNSTGTATRGFAGVGESIRGALGNTSLFGQSLSSLGGAFTSAGGMATLMQGAVAGLAMALVNMATQALTKAISGLGEFVGKGIELASDLTEIQNVLDTTFKENAEAVNEWSTATADAFGLTELQAKQFSSTMGAILNGMNITGQQSMVMSQQVAQLSGDLASFYNLEHQEAFDKIRAGLLGETEPLKALGIVMSETNLSTYALESGLGKAYSKMSESEKTILRYNYLIEQTSLAHGDFAKTADSYSNSQKQLENNFDTMGAKIGEALLPFLTKVSMTISSLVQGLTPIASFIAQLIGGMLDTLMTLLKPLVEILNVLLGLLNPIFEALGGVFKTVTDALGDVSSSFTEQMGKAQTTTGETMEYTTEKIKEETDDALGYVKSATEKWVEQQVSEYRKKNEQQFGDSLSAMIRTEKNTEIYREKMEKVADNTIKRYENREKQKTKILDDELKKRQKLENSFFSKMSSAMSSGSSNKAYATGTSYHTGGLAMVGEVGRELVELPRGATVYNNRQTENILNSANSNSTQNIYVSVEAGNIRELNDITSLFNNYTKNTRMGVD